MNYNFIMFSPTERIISLYLEEMDRVKGLRKQGISFPVLEEKKKKQISFIY